MDRDTIQFPRQALPSSRKTKKWGEKCLLWGDSRTLWNYNPVRNSIRHKKINYDLLNGKLHMEDLAVVLNPSELSQDFIPKKIQHFPIMNSKLEVLIGEELKRPFDWRAIVTNPNAISDIERTKKEKLLESFRKTVEDESLSPEDYMQRLEELDEYYTYHYQDFREKRANEVVKHYSKEYNLPLVFNEGFKDALAVGEELYQVDIEGGEPVVRRINPNSLRIYRMGRSNKVEDADIIIIEEYWNPGRVLDVYGQELKKRDIEYLENLPSYLGTGTNSMGYADERQGFVRRDMVSDSYPTYEASEVFSGIEGFADDYNLLPYDTDGNVRVMRMYWKSKKLIMKVKKYDPETGKPYFAFYDERYVPDESMGEEVEELYGNEAWEGTLIGGNKTDFDAHSTDGTYGIFVRIRPKPVQFGRLSNPSRCHLGVIGTIYNLNSDKPYSMVDMMKPYNYMYNVIYNRLSETIASSFGTLVDVDLALIPDEWDMTKWFYFAKKNHIAVRNSFNEGNEGAAKGKLAGAMNNNTQRIINDATGNYIQQLINLAEWTKTEMGDMVGINRQREGQIANRETVGGVERATLQSSYITERYFAYHSDTKRRTLDALVEASKIAAKGKDIKFRYIESDSSLKLMEFNGDEYSENDYGILVDASSDTLNLDQKIEMLGQAALQTGQSTLSDIMRMFTATCSISDKIRILEAGEKKRRTQQQQEQQMQIQAQQEASQAQIQEKQMELESTMRMNSENNETKILIAQMEAEAKLQATAIQNPEDDGIEAPMSEEAKAKLKEQIREFDLKIQQDNKKLDLEREKLRQVEQTSNNK